MDNYKKQLLIIGNGIYAKMLHSYLATDVFIMHKYTIVGFVADEQYINEAYMESLPVLSFRQLNNYPCDETELVIGVGYKHMGDYRKALFERCKNKGYSFINYYHPTAVIHPSVEIGEGNIILENVVLESGCRIGNANLFYGGAILGHDSSLGSYSTFSVGAMTAGCVEIMNNCFLGVRAAVRDNVKLGDYSLVGATAYAYKDVPNGYVVYSPRCTISGEEHSTDLI